MIKTTRFEIRAMSESDITQVADIEAESFPTTWPRTAYRREMSNHMARYLVLVDKDRGKIETREQPRRSLTRFWRREEEVRSVEDFIVGYIGIWLMVDQAHVVAIAVREAYRGRGFGELLLAEAIEVSIENRQEAVTLEVRASNEIAQSLYSKYRFLKIGVRKRYYSDNNEDAIVMSTPPIQDDGYLSMLAYYKDALKQRWQAEESAQAAK